MQTRYFYGWSIVAVAALGIGCSGVVLVSALTGIFAGPLRAELGFTVQQIYFGSSLGGICGILTAPLAGRLADIHGAKKVVAISFVAEAFTLMSFKYLDANLAGYLVRDVILLALCVGTTHVVFGRVVAAWFDRRLGLALGIALAGVGLGGAVWSVAAQWLIERYGWRDTYMVIGGFVLVIVVPIVLLVLRESPATMGLQIDGDRSPPQTASGQPALPFGATMREALADRQYWLMLGTALLIGAPLQAMQFHMVPLLVSHGAVPRTAALVQSTLWIAVILGRLSSGWFADKYFAPRVAQAFLLPPMLGIVALLMDGSGPLMFFAAAFIGLAVGCEYSIFAYLVRRYFGLRAYSAIYGTFFSVFGLGGAIGPSATAWAVERTATGYDGAMTVALVIIAAGICMFFLYRPYPSRNP